MHLAAAKFRAFANRFGQEIRRMGSFSAKRSEFIVASDNRGHGKSFPINCSRLTSKCAATSAKTAESVRREANRVVEW
jgi:hypothetical protein